MFELDLHIKIEKTELAKQLEKDLNISWNLYQHYDYDAGYDVRACIEEPIYLEPNMERKIIPIGLHIELTNPNYEIQVRPRSGLAADHGISVLNTPGTIDYGYRDEIKVILVNLDLFNEFTVNPGDRIAQLCFRKIPTLWIESVDEIDKEINRKGGFGSSGI